MESGLPITRSACSTLKVIVCLGSISVTAQIGFAGRERCRRMETTIEFSFLDVAGGTRGGLAKDMVFTLIDANKHSIGLNFITPDGKAVNVRGEFQRTK